MGVLALALLAAPAPAAAEWQLRPFLGVTFGAETTFIDLDHAVDEAHVVFGASGGWLGELFGIEADFGVVPWFFQADPSSLILQSGVTTLTANAVVALPRRMAQYSLRPYLSGGGGVMWLEIEPRLDVLPVSRRLPVLTVGGGVTGFVSSRVGVNWDVRYFRSLESDDLRGASFGAEQLSFWRANMALAFRY